MAVKLLTTVALNEDLVLPMGQRVVMLDFDVPLLPGRRKVRFNLQGGAFINTFATHHIGMTLKFELGIHAIVTSPTTVLLPEAGDEGPGTFASGDVTFTGLPDGTVIPANTMLTRTGSAVAYAVQVETPEEGNAATVPVRAVSPGMAGNCPVGTSFQTFGGLSGFASTAFTGGADASPGATQFMLKTGNVTWTGEESVGRPETGHPHPVKIYVTETAARNAAPGFPMPDAPWTLMGVGGEPNVPLRWPWFLTVEDLEGDLDSDV